MSLKIKALSILLIVGFSFLSNSNCYSQSYQNEAGFMSDNDLYIAFNQDRYYTNGAFAFFRYALKQESLNAKLEKKIADFEIGHKIYNAHWSHLPDAKTHDRPFAGYAYGTASMGWFYKNESILKASAQLGIIGPIALGKEVQNFYHKKILNSYYTVEGWEHQIKNEIGLNFELSYQGLFYHSANRLIDISGSSAALIGNTFSGANAGLLIRFGKMNPFYESSYANSRIKNKAGDKRRTPSEIYLFTKPQLNFAAYDATIQGGLFRSDKGPVTFGIKNWVYSQQIGVNFAWKRLSSKLIVILKTKEVESVARAYHYGSASFSYNFTKN